MRRSPVVSRVMLAQVGRLLIFPCPIVEIKRNTYTLRHVGPIIVKIKCSMYVKYCSIFIAFNFLGISLFHIKTVIAIGLFHKQPLDDILPFEAILMCIMVSFAVLPCCVQQV